MSKPPAKTPRKRAPRRKAPAKRRATPGRAAATKAGAAPGVAKAVPIAATHVAAFETVSASHAAVSATLTAATAASTKAATAAGAGGSGGGGGAIGQAAPGKGYSRGSKSAKVIGGAAPLAIALAAMAVPDAQPVRAPPERPPAVKPAAAPNTQLSAVPASRATPQCLNRYRAVALPAHGSSDVGARQVLICRNSYVLSLNVDTRDPDWVMERITAAELTGPAARRNNFRSDDLAGGTDATNADYLRSGFDRGHQAPAGDAKSSQPAMDDSFFFTNMAPQIGAGFNRGAWKFLEETVRGWVLCGGHSELFVITGPIYGQNPRTIGANRVYVPREFYKIVYDPVSGHGVGFVLPNMVIGSRIDLQLYVRPIADIETATGLDFFSSFDQRRQTILESGPGTAWANNGACPGDGGD